MGPKTSMRLTPFDNMIISGCPCNPAPEEGEYCVCDQAERCLRAYIKDMAPSTMTEEQRKWCLEEIDMVEGYDAKEWDDASDKDMARGVLSAWLDYCRDKGLL